MVRFDTPTISSTFLPKKQKGKVNVHYANQSGDIINVRAFFPHIYAFFGKRVCGMSIPFKLHFKYLPTYRPMAKQRKKSSKKKEVFNNKR